MLKEQETAVDLIVYFLTYFQEKIVPKEKFYKIFFLLLISNKGLMNYEVCEMVGISLEEWNLIFTIFKHYIIRFGELYYIMSVQFHQAIYKINLEL